MGATFGNTHMTTGNTAMPLTVDKRFPSCHDIWLLPANVLDCGCGLGQYVRLLSQQLGLDTFGVEYKQAAVDSIQSDAFLKRRIIQGDLQRLNYANDEWDYAMLNEVLEHVADEMKVLREIHNILKPGGLLFVFSPNRWFPFETHGVSLRNNRTAHLLALRLSLGFPSGWAGISMPLGPEITGRASWKKC